MRCSAARVVRESPGFLCHSEQVESLEAVRFTATQTFSEIICGFQFVWFRSVNHTYFFVDAMRRNVSFIEAPVPSFSRLSRQ